MMQGDSKLSWTTVSTCFWLSSTEIKAYATTAGLLFAGFQYLVLELFI